MIAIPSSMGRIIKEQVVVAMPLAMLQKNNFSFMESS